jgi:hypothetical protein
VSLGFVAQELWIARSLVLSPHLVFAAASLVGGIEAR